MIIIIHSSKTMRKPENLNINLEEPALIEKAKQISKQLTRMSLDEIKKEMKVSDNLALETHGIIKRWGTQNSSKRYAVDSFIGDIYSGLQFNNWSADDMQYANKYLRILSGLYGILKPLDGIDQYRLEMGYKIKINGYDNLYGFWGDSIAKTIAENEVIINLSAVEYSKVITKYHDKNLVITPKFMTVDKMTKKPKFVVVHAKIARGAFAYWILRNRIKEIEHLQNFNDLGYRYKEELSTKLEPVFVCNNFEGTGLSIRLS